MDIQSEDSNELRFNWQPDPLSGSWDPTYQCRIGSVFLTATSESWRAYGTNRGITEVINSGGGGQREAEDWYRETYSSPESRRSSFYAGPVPTVPLKTVRHIAENLPRWMDENTPEPVLELLRPVFADMGRIAGTEQSAYAAAVAQCEAVIDREIMSPATRVFNHYAEDLQSAANWGYAVECALYNYLAHARRFGVTPSNEVSPNVDNEAAVGHESPVA